MARLLSCAGGVSTTYKNPNAQAKPVTSWTRVALLAMPAPLVERVELS